MGDKAFVGRQENDGVGRADNVFQRFGGNVPVQFIKIVIEPYRAVYQVFETICINSGRQVQRLIGFNVQVIADFGHVVRLFLTVDGYGFKRDIGPAPVAVTRIVVFGQNAEKAVGKTFVVGYENKFFGYAEQTGRFNLYGGQDIGKMLIGRGKDFPAVGKLYRNIREVGYKRPGFVVFGFFQAIKRALQLDIFVYRVADASRIAHAFAIYFFVSRKSCFFLLFYFVGINDAGSGGNGGFVGVNVGRRCQAQAFGQVGADVVFVV